MNLLFSINLAGFIVDEPISAIIAASIAAIAAIITAIITARNSLALYKAKNENLEKQEKITQQDTFRDDLIQHIATQDERLDKALKRVDALQEVIEGLREQNAHLLQDKWQKEQTILELKSTINKLTIKVNRMEI